MRQRVYKKKLILFRRWANKHYAAFNSLHKTIKICTLVVAYSLVSVPERAKAVSGNDSIMLSTQEIDDVVIQSTLIELKNAETGRSIEVIPGAQIQSLPVTSIDELLRYIPGVDAQQRGAFGAQTDFSLRGSNFNQVLVLIDGQKINDPLTAHFNSNIPISPSEIERIEIIRGPASAEYGPDATGGVINIISKTFSPNSQYIGLQADAKANAGKYNLINGAGGIYYGSPKYRFSAGAMINKSDGNPIALGLKNYFDIRDVSLSGQYQINPIWSAAYRYAYDFRDFNAKNFYTDYQSDMAVERVTRHRNQFQLTRNIENFSTQIISSIVTTQDYYLFSPKSKPNENSSGNLNVKVLQQLQFIEDIKLLTGVTYERLYVNSSNRGDHSLNHYGAFLTSSIKPVEKFVFNAGVRWDYDNFNGSYFLPQVGASYRLSRAFILRASWGRSIRTADFTEKYNDTNLDTIKSTPGIGNSSLKAEKSWNTEAGIDITIFRGVIFSVTGFNRSSTDIIDYVLTPSTEIPVNAVIVGSPKYYAKNNSKTVTNGIESRFSLNQNVNNVNLRFAVGYTYLNINNKFQDTAKYAMLQPKHLVNGEVALSIGRFTWGVNGIFKKRNSVFSKNYKGYLIDNYTVFNTNIDIAVYKRSGYLSLSIFNIFNKSYSDFFGAEMPGRWIAGGIKFKL